MVIPIIGGLLAAFFITWIVDFAIWPQWGHLAANMLAIVGGYYVCIRLSQERNAKKTAVIYGIAHWLVGNANILHSYWDNIFGPDAHVVHLQAVLIAWVLYIVPFAVIGTIVYKFTRSGA